MMLVGVPMITPPAVGAIRISDKQSIAGVGQAAGRAEDDVAGIRILRCESGLPDHQPRGLSRGKVRGAYGGRRK